MSTNLYQKGYVLLYSVIIVAAIGTAVAITILSLGLSTSQTSGNVVESSQAGAIADACGELALQKLVTSVVFVGSSTVSIGQGSCTYVVTAQGTSGSIIATGRVGQSVRRVQITLTLPTLTTISWQEIP